MRKRFNVTGSCNPEKHYMVDTEKRFMAVRELIDAGAYFTINRARQYGKTTMLNMIWRKLSEKYLIIDTSFEGVGDAVFESEASFVRLVVSLMKDALDYGAELQTSVLDESVPTTMKELSKIIIRFCQSAQKPVLLMIDEVDKSIDNQLFLSFIGMLRELYLMRDKQGMNYTFHSVILAGVYDIKNLKLKLRPDAEKKYNSPWNIAADFNVDMTFHPEEIAQMLTDYENDVHTGMDVHLMGEEIYKFTSGYPFLVSKLCKVIDEELDRDWTVEGVVKAVKQTVDRKNTLFDSLTKNLENDKAFKDFIYAVSMLDTKILYTFSNPLIELGNMFSYIKRGPDNNVMMHNLIFEEVVHNHFITEELISNTMKFLPYNDREDYVSRGMLNMETILVRFREFIREEYREEDADFIERQGRLLFLSFLKPIINGTGNYYVEPQTRGNRRMDLVVNYNNKEFVVELKIWRGAAYEEKGKDQLADYLDIRGMKEGYLVTFDFTKNKSHAEPQWIEWNEKRIFEVIV